MRRVKRHKKAMTFQVFEDQLEVLQKIAGDTGLSQAEGRTSVHRPRHRRIRYGTVET